MLLSERYVSKKDSLSAAYLNLFAGGFSVIVNLRGFTVNFFCVFPKDARRETKAPSVFLLALSIFESGRLPIDLRNCCCRVRLLVQVR